MVPDETEVDVCVQDASTQGHTSDTPLVGQYGEQYTTILCEMFIIMNNRFERFLG